MANNYEKKQRRTRRLAAVVAGLLAFLMIASTVMGAVSASAVSQATVNALKDQLSSVTTKKKNAKKELASLQSQKSSILAEIEKLDAAIEAATEEIEVQQQLITELEGLIEVKELELAESQQKEETQYAKLKDRVRFMHENGSMSYLSILLSSDDFADFLSRYEIVSQISKYDKNLFEELKALKEQIAEQKASLEADHADAVTLKASMDENKRTLEVQFNERNAQMKKVEEAEAEAKVQYAEIAKEEDKITAAVQKAVRELAAQSSSTYVGGNMMWPLPAANNVITCKYGMRTHPITGVYKLHTGIDLRASTGTKIYAANAGTVIKATYSSAYGYYVVVNHGGGTSTLYAHMSKMAVKNGQKVSQGTVLGYVGSTGYSTGPHLHFEVIKNGNYVNPVTMYPNFKVVYK
ncbi:MAG: peptidoglycan DD-metalloendopeptidase family protein [Clostridia bacterium]|nr:peptidoglycan DD-metalloendopeptidase family protein [Clostridia bacterium]MBQ2326331.1 peptidoglycan DD-metalloendopeptidase family protein [Clostridia bacterium]